MAFLLVVWRLEEWRHGLAFAFSQGVFRLQLKVLLASPFIWQVDLLRPLFFSLHFDDD